MDTWFYGDKILWRIVHTFNGTQDFQMGVVSGGSTETWFCGGPVALSTELKISSLKWETVPAAKERLFFCARPRLTRGL